MVFVHLRFSLIGLKHLCPKVVWRNQPHPGFPLYRLLLPSNIIDQGEELIFAAFTLMFIKLNRMLYTLKAAITADLKAKSGICLSSAAPWKLEAGISLIYATKQQAITNNSLPLPVKNTWHQDFQLREGGGGLMWVTSLCPVGYLNLGT